jgi:hypothetical protein
MMRLIEKSDLRDKRVERNEAGRRAYELRRCDMSPTANIDPKAAFHEALH